MNPSRIATTVVQPAAHRRQIARPAWGSLIGGLVLGVALALLGVVLLGMPLALTRSTPLPLEAFYGEQAVRLAVGRVAGSGANPLAGNQEAIAAGAATYKQACAGCHAPNGSGRGGVAGGEYFYPPASNLTLPGTQEKGDAELHWIIKHGLGFTGMPRYGERMDDAKIWSIVAYLRTMPPQP